MTTSSASPDDLDRYAATGREATDAWAPLVRALSESLQAARVALGRAVLPPGIGIAVPRLDDELGDALLDVTHLDRWVASVAAAFRAADAGRSATGSLTVDDDHLRVGLADRHVAEVRARLDAGALAKALGAGFPAPDPTGRGADPADTARRVKALADVLAAIESRRYDTDGAAALVNALGPTGVRTLLDAINEIGVLADRGVVDAAHTFDDVVVPAARVLGDADRSGGTAPTVRDELLDLGVAADPSAAPFLALGLGGQAEAVATTDRRRRALALVLVAGRFSAATTAAAVGRVLRSPPADPFPFGGEGFTGALAAERPDLALTETLALTALLDDDAALGAFLADRNAGPYGTNLTALLQPASAVTGDGHARYRERRIDVLDRGLVQLPALGAITPDAETATAVAVIDTVGQVRADHALDPDTQRALALFSARVTPDLATAADPVDDPNLPRGRFGAVARGDITGFLTAISGDAQARRLLLADGSALLHATLAASAEAIASGDTDFAMGTAHVVGFFGALFDAARRAGAEAVAEHADAVAALSTVLTPVFDLVGYAVLKGGGTALAVARSAAHARSTSLAEQVAELIVPDTEIADLEKLDATIQSAFLDQARRALFENAAARTLLGGPPSLVGLSPATVEAVYRAFVAPDAAAATRSTRPTASSRLRPIENGFTSMFRTMVTFDEMTDRLDHQPGTRPR